MIGDEKRVSGERGRSGKMERGRGRGSGGQDAQVLETRR
jgi:hypothetical protein